MNQLFRIISIPIFILISTVLYILFIFFPQYVHVVKLEYLGILLCLVFSFLIYDKKRDTWIVRIALFFTAIADLFLLLLKGYELVGVFVFCVVQLAYGIRLLLMQDIKLNLKQQIKIRIIIILFFQIIALYLIENVDVLACVTFFYFSNLFTNMVIAFIHFKLNKVFAIGLLLFLFCDIFVGLNNAQAYLELSDTIWEKLINYPIDFMWFFYFPSQVLLTLSILTNKFK